MVTLLFVGLLVAAVVLDLIVFRPLEGLRGSQLRQERPVEFVVPRSLFFHPSHVWLRVEDDGQVTVGIDDLLRTMLGSIDKVVLPAQGERLRADDEVVTLTHAGATLRLPAPVSGTVTAVNRVFGSDQASLRSRPYREGWLYRLQPAEDLARRLGALTIGREATAWMREEAERLRDLYADDVLVGPVEGVLERAGEATWRVVQERFLDRARQSAQVPEV